MIANQFGNPHGLFGRVVGSLLVRANGEFNRWIVQQVRTESRGEPTRIVEVGPGPGVGLEETLRAFPQARVWGVDISPQMLSRSRKRNLEAVENGRLTLVEGGVGSLAKLAPVDIVLAVQVLYFWRRPEVELAQVRESLGAGGLLALGFQLRPHMPKAAQRGFASGGQTLYDSEDEVTRVLQDAGFGAVRYRVKGPPEAPDGRLALAEVNMDWRMGGATRPRSPDATPRASP